MTFVQARNAIISGLKNYIGCDVVPEDSIAEMPPFPYCRYSVLTSRTSGHSFGLNELKETPSGLVATRSEEVTATLSFTLCGMDRQTETGYILGEDEALELSEKAHGFFLLNAHNIITEYGEIVINKVGTVINRGRFFVTNAIHSYGFDVSFSYVRTDEKPAVTIAPPIRSKGKHIIK